MAEGCSFLCSKKLLADLDYLHDEVKKLSTFRKFPELAFAGHKPCPKYMVSKIREQIIVLHSLLDKIESDCQENTKITTVLKELQDTVEKEQNKADFFLEVLPNCCSAWGSCETGESQEHNERQQGKETKPTKASEKSGVPSKMLAITPEDLERVPAETGESQEHNERQQGKETKPTKASEKSGVPSKMLAITPEDLERVPAYMKGRITCDQINAVVKNLNRAMMNKHKIRNQAPSSMNATHRALYYRYIREENEDKEGCSFVVEDDIKLFTSMKLDKRFHQIITILRHCQRLREIRIAGITRYAIC